MLEAKEFSTYKLLQSTFRIPNYQRGYAWKVDNVETLINDLLDAIEQKKDFYFLSTITICLEGEDGKGGYVIDGQQRLITLTLLLHELHILLGNDSFLSTKTEACILDLEKSNTDAKVLRIELNNEEDKKDFESILLTENSYLKKSKSKINESYKAIQSELQKLTNIEREKLATFLLDDVYLIKSEVLNEEHACQIFESLNDRGVPLTAFDLIKNRLFLVSKDTDLTHKNIKIIQNKITGALGNGRSLSPNTRDYFRIFMQINQDEEHYVDDGVMYKVFKKQALTAEKSDDFLKRLTQEDNLQAFFSLKIESLKYDSVKTLVSKSKKLDILEHYFDYVRSFNICHPVLFSIFFHKNLENIETSLQDLYCLLRRLTLRKDRPFRIQDILSHCAYRIYHNNENFSDVLKEFIVGTEHEDRYIHHFKDALKGVTDFKEKDSKDILFDILKLSPVNEMSTVRRPYKEVSCEHILPQERRKDTYKSFSNDESKLYLNSLGNHTILITSDNSRNGNRTIDEKIKLFNEEKYKSFSVVSKIEKYLNSDGDWTIDSIKRRKEDLVEEYVNLVKFSWQ